MGALVNYSDLDLDCAMLGEFTLLELDYTKYNMLKSAV